MSDVRCALLLADNHAATTATKELAKLLAIPLGRTAFDLRHDIRRGAGFLARALPPELARELASVVSQAGHKAVAIDERRLLPLPKTQRLRRITMRAESLELELGSTRLSSVPWSDIQCLHAYAFSAVRDLRDQQSHTGGVSVRGIRDISPHARTLQWDMSSHEDRFRSSRLTLCLDLISVTASYLTRIEHDGFSFDCLTETKNHSIDSFLALLTALRARCGAAAIPWRTQNLATEGSPLKSFLLEKHEERERANEWLIQRLGIGQRGRPKQA